MRDVLLIGLGNTGLALAEHVARMPGIRSALLCDPDEFTRGNLAGQAISIAAVGADKVSVGAERIAGIRPEMRIETRKCELELLPRGLFRNRIVVSGLDSRHARAALGRICFAAGCSLWLDMGIRRAGNLARVSATFPSESEAACPCCGWSARDWSALRAEFACDGAAQAAPTASPAFLGAAAAAMAAQLLEGYLRGSLAACAEVRHRVLSLESHRAWTTRVRRNGECGGGHERWDIARLGLSAANCALRELARRGATLALPGLTFVRRLRCPCGARRGALHVAGRMSPQAAICRDCGRQMSSGAIDLSDVVDLNPAALEDPGLEPPALTLADIGIVPGDVIALGDGYFEVGGA